jgi:dienelactone hydrolase
MSGPGATKKREPRAPDKSGQLPPVATTSADVKAGLNWALAENAKAGSALYGKIDTRALAVAGHSCGGLQALEVAPDPRIRAVLVHNSGVFTDGTNPIRGITVNKAMLEKLHTPVLYVLGGPDDIAFPNGTDDFKRISKVPAALVQLPVGHGGTFRTANGGAVAALSVDWLEWQLRGDKSAARSFTGSNCRLCVVPGWTIEKKGID